MNRFSVPDCPYCGKPAKLVDGIEVYPRSDQFKGQNFWRCLACDAFVGCHEGSIKPLGPLANPDLRKAKGNAHAYFDPIWQKKMRRDNCSREEARAAGLRWLADQLGIEKPILIAEMDLETCNRVVQICTAFYQKQSKEPANGESLDGGA